MLQQQDTPRLRYDAPMQPDPHLPHWRMATAIVGLLVFGLQLVTVLNPHMVEYNPEESANAGQALAAAEGPWRYFLRLQYVDFCGGCTVDDLLGAGVFSLLPPTWLADLEAARAAPDIVAAAHRSFWQHWLQSFGEPAVRPAAGPAQDGLAWVHGMTPGQAVGGCWGPVETDMVAMLDRETARRGTLPSPAWLEGLGFGVGTICGPDPMV